MKKAAAVISATLFQAVNTAAHLTHQQEPMNMQGAHATNIELAILVLLTVLAFGMIYYGLSNATRNIPEPEEEEEDDKEAGESDEGSGDEE